jgi:hypothetical protein
MQYVSLGGYLIMLVSKLLYRKFMKEKIWKQPWPTQYILAKIQGKHCVRPNMVHWLYTRVIRPSIGTLVWWSKAMQQTAKIQLGRIQRTICLAIMGAEIDPHSSNGGALGADSTRSADHGRSKDGTL